MAITLAMLALEYPPQDYPGFLPAARARELLMRVLTPEQRAFYRMDRSFFVTTPYGAKFHLLPIPSFGVISQQAGFRYCARPMQYMPVEDILIAQKLLLENDPEQFFGVAIAMTGGDGVSPDILKDLPPGFDAVRHYGTRPYTR